MVEGNLTSTRGAQQLNTGDLSHRARETIVEAMDVQGGKREFGDIFTSAVCKQDIPVAVALDLLYSYDRWVGDTELSKARSLREHQEVESAKVEIVAQCGVIPASVADKVSDRIWELASHDYVDDRKTTLADVAAESDDNQVLECDLCGQFRPVSDSTCECGHASAQRHEMTDDGEDIDDIVAEVNANGECGDWQTLDDALDRLGVEPEQTAGDVDQRIAQDYDSGSVWGDVAEMNSAAYER